MKVIYKGPQTGKTMDLIETSGRLGWYIIVPDRQQALLVAQMAGDAKIQIPFPLTFYEFMHGEYPNTIRGFLIDNLDQIIRSLSLNVPIRAVTMTDEGADMRKEADRLREEERKRFDNKLLSYQFRPGNPQTYQTHFARIVCECGAEYSTALAFYENNPASDKAILESFATCPICHVTLAEAKFINTYAGSGGAIRPIPEEMRQKRKSKGRLDI